MEAMDSTRVDRWLWAVRVYKTRQAANEACRAGHVRVNDGRVKPAATVRVGDTVSARAGGRERVLEVARVIDKRVGAPAAAECVIDRSPPPPPPEPAAGGDRDRGAGRPTKRERRQLERARGLDRARGRRER